MPEVPLHRRFAGQARLVRLLLWRIGDSTDIDACLRVAREASMIDGDDEAFLRECLAQEERHRDDDAAAAETTLDVVMRLQRCADKLNRADSA